MYRLLLTLCLGEFVFPAVVAAAAAPPATPMAETRAKIEAQRRKIAAVPVPANLQRRTLKVGPVEREFFIHALEGHGHGFPMQKGFAVADTGPKTLFKKHPKP